MVPLRLNTAFQVLYGSRVLKLVQPFDQAAPVQGETWIFIYGGSTCVGLYAIQLAKLSGYKIVTVASPRNHELLKKYGADAVFDARIFTLSASDLRLLWLTRVCTVQGSRYDPEG
jgi:NADPH:quinone reductase-like Zn-dependent oxidoreductase